MLRRITIVRHGESKGNADPKVYLETPDSMVELTELGKKQASELADHMGGLLHDLSYHSSHPDFLTAKTLIYYSPYTRAVETFEMFRKSIQERCPEILESLSVIEDPLLREHEYEQDPDSVETVKAELKYMAAKGVAKFYHRFLNGESYADVDQRVALFLSLAERRIYSHEHTFIICHGHTEQLLLKRLLGLSVEDFGDLTCLDNCEHVTLIVSDDGSFTLDKKNSRAKKQIEDLEKIFEKKNLKIN